MRASQKERNGHSVQKVVTPPPVRMRGQAGHLLGLQRTLGNRCVQRLLAPPSEARTTISPPLEDRIQHAVGNGQVLNDDVRTHLEPAFGVDFGGVRVHTDAEADALSSQLEARAFTVGADVFFRHGEYRPESSTGRELLAHELTHVVQQAGAVQTKLEVSSPDDAYEREADRVAQQIAQADELPTPMARAQAVPQVQREASGAKKSEEKAEKPFNFDEWLHGKIYDLVKEHLGDEKLKKYGTDLAKKAADFLLAQAKGTMPDANDLQKAQLDELGKLLAADLKQGVTELLADEKTKELRDALLKKFKVDPHFAVGMVLLAAAAAVGIAYAANVEIPKLEKEVELGKGFKAAGKVELGRVREISFQHLEAGLSYTSKYFKAGLTGNYTGAGKDEGFGGKAEASVGTKEVSFKTDAVVSPDGRFKLNLSPALDFKKFGLTGTTTFDTGAGWSGKAMLRLGTNDVFVAPNVTVGANGELSFGLDQKLSGRGVSLTQSLAVGPDQIKQSYGLGLDDPFGLRGLNLKANLGYRLDDPHLTGFGLSGSYNLLGSPGDTKRSFLFIKIEGKYEPASKEKPLPSAGGFIFLQGRIPGL